MIYFYRKTKKDKGGLILLEMIVAIGIFLSVMTIAMGALLTIYGVSKKSQSLKTVMDNLNFAVESIAREIVVGTDYHCPEGGGFDARSCDTGDGDGEGEESLTFCSSNNEQIFYRYNSSNKSIERYIEEDGVNETCGEGNPNDNDWISVTAPEVVITRMKFYVTGAEANEADQPLVLMLIEGEAGVREEEKSDFNLQVTLSQRAPKIVN